MALKNIFIGCHKDQMRTTLSLRAILYENLTQIFENITDFMDDKFLQDVLKFIFEEKASIGSLSSISGPKPQQAPQKKEKEEKPKNKGILKNSEDDHKFSKNMRRSEMQSVAGQVISLDMDFYT